MAITFIGLGSNLGRRRKNILTAWNKLTSQKDNQAMGISSPYLSEPVGIVSENWFINAVAMMKTRLSPINLLDEMLNIETEMGRDRSKGDDRIIDLDLLYYNDLILDEKNLILPHPGISSRLFVLQPLMEIAPEQKHPVSGKTSKEMLELLDSQDTVKKTTWNQEL